MASTALRLETCAGDKPDHKILRLQGPLLLANLFDFQTAVRSDASAVLILDLSQVPYIDSAGVGALVGAQVSRQGNGRELRVVGITDRVRTVLSVTQVEGFFKYFATVEDAERQAA